MFARIITLANQKGGTGKTTATMLLAGTLARRGRKVLVIDADPQGSATRWAAGADDDSPFPAAVAGMAGAGSKVHREAKKYVGDYEFIVIDCPPAVDSPIPQSALLISDLSIIPVIPSPTDLWATRGIVKLVENAQAVNESLAARILPNMCQPRTTLGQDALDVLNEFDFPLMPFRWHHRIAYREAAAIGGTVHDLGARARDAIEEVDKLTDAVLDIIS